MTFGWTAGEEASFAIMDAYVAAGGNFLDTADIYSRWIRGHGGGESERIIGRWLASRGGRDRLVIATKVRGRMWPGPAGEGLGREHIIKACEASLKRLGVETIDLYQFHWADESVPVEESLRAIEGLVQAGKVRYLAVSNHTPAELRRLLDVSAGQGLPSVVALQPHYNLVHRPEYEAGLEALCLERGLGVIPYSPLAKGFLTGKYAEGRAPATRAKQYDSPGAWATLAKVRDLAATHGTTPTAVVLAWLLARPSVTAPIVGANSVEQLRDQLVALDLSLTAEELAELAN
jgi:aryl-alcohol dehydrogenase-like predicted oxidoreductase